MTPLAIRSSNRKRIQVTFDDGAGKALGGKRCERATAVIIIRDKAHGPQEVLGVRADYAAAEAEAHRLATATTIRVRGGGEIPVTPCAEAFVVPVQESPVGPADPRSPMEIAADRLDAGSYDRPVPLP